MVLDITNYIDQKKYSFGIFIDFKKVFNIVKKKFSIRKVLCQNTDVGLYKKVSVNEKA